MNYHLLFACLLCVGCNNSITTVGRVPKQLEIGQSINQLKKQNIVPKLSDNQHLIAQISYKNKKIVEQKAYLLTTNKDDVIIDIQPYTKPITPPKLGNKPYLPAKQSIIVRLFSDIGYVNVL